MVAVGVAAVGASGGARTASDRREPRRAVCEVEV